MSTIIKHGQMSVVDVDGNVTVLHQENSATDVLVDRTTNTQGENDTSAIPSDVDTLQKLANKLGKLAFKSNIESTDLTFGFVVNNFTTTTTGSALDAVKGKELNDRLTTIEDSELLIIGTDVEDSDDILPVSEINDDVVSVASTWSSAKIDSFAGSGNFYISLNQTGDETYTTIVTLEEIEAAYQKGRFLWVTASNLHLPLRVRNSAVEWIFSGYVNHRACDVQLDANGVTFTYTSLEGIETVYDVDNDTVIFK